MRESGIEVLTYKFTNQSISDLLDIITWFCLCVLLTIFLAVIWMYWLIICWRQRLSHFPISNIFRNTFMKETFIQKQKKYLRLNMFTAMGRKTLTIRTIRSNSLTWLSWSLTDHNWDVQYLLENVGTSKELWHLKTLYRSTVLVGDLNKIIYYNNLQ